MALKINQITAPTSAAFAILEAKFADLVKITQTPDNREVLVNVCSMMMGGIQVQPTNKNLDKLRIMSRTESGKDVSSSAPKVLWTDVEIGEEERVLYIKTDILYKIILNKVKQ